MVNKRILVALDDSQAEAIFAEALALARQEQAHLMLLHVLSTDERDESPLTTLLPYSSRRCHNDIVQGYRYQRERAEQQSLSQLRSFAERARAVGIDAEVDQLVGNPRQLICRYAQEWGADLIVVGRRQRPWWVKWLLGSVSHTVTHYAPCAVQVIPQIPQPLGG